LNVSYSQEGEDLVLARIFGDASVGVYVDVGAHHPLRFSNTHKFYLQGWRGVNIEPNPQMSAIFQAVRPEDVNLTCGVSDEYGSLTYYMFNEAALNSFDQALAHSREGELYQIIETRALHVLPLSDILEQCLAEGTPIHFLSVDVEGLDLKVLRSNDWARFRPKCVVAECLASDVQTVLASPLHNFCRNRATTSSRRRSTPSSISNTVSAAADSLKLGFNRA
jgi:FkbM family methyltransferase